MREPQKALDVEGVRRHLESIFGDDLHAKRVLSLANATIGVMQAAAAGIHAIGRGLAAARGVDRKHATKQIDRLLSNSGLDVDALFAVWVPFVLGARPEAVVALDWTDFDGDDQTTLGLYLVTSHGRATPLMWRTVRKSELKKRRNEYEDTPLERFAKVKPERVVATVLADRGFADRELFEWLPKLGLEFIIRFRDTMYVTSAEGEKRQGRDWVPSGGRALVLRNAAVTHDGPVVGTVLCVKKRGMKENWCLACSSRSAPGSDLVALYGKRFTIEETFRDQKDEHFGMGLKATHIGSPERRDRLLLVMALAQYLLTLLGAAGEKAGLDRRLKTNTSKKRQLSLFNQGSFWFEALPNLKPHVFAPLMEAFGEMLVEQPTLAQLFSSV
jgi:hypothetical protein